MAGNVRPSRFVLLSSALRFVACDPRTTEQPGPDPRLEAEVERTREALEAGPLKAPGTALVWWPSSTAASCAGRAAFGQSMTAGFEPGHVFAVPQMGAAGAGGRARTAGRPGPARSGSDLRRREMLALPEEKLATALAARVDQESGDGWRDYLQQEILDPLAMKSAKPAGRRSADAPRSERRGPGQADGRPAKGARRPHLEAAHPASERSSSSPATATPARASASSSAAKARPSTSSAAAAPATSRSCFVGFVSSGNGAVIFGPSDEVVEGAH